MKLSAYPSLQPAEFTAVCRAFYSRFQRSPSSRTSEWTVTLRPDVTSPPLPTKKKKNLPPLTAKPQPTAAEYITITRALAPEGEGGEVDDEEALVRGRYVQYDVLLSAAYRVPVLWVAVVGEEEEGLEGLEGLYEMLVPQGLRGAVRGVGVLGGIGAANHPLTGVPTFFVHPCNTADAMGELGKGREEEGQQPGVEEYLVLWLGLVGGCVGLWVPADVAAA